MIVFVGDKPSAKNLDPDIPFVGTRSYKTLLEWIWKLDIDISQVQLKNKDGVVSADPEYTYIALGHYAERKLKTMGVDYFHLPHPSPRNRKLNDRMYVRNQLNLCKDWLNEKTKA